MDVIQLSGYTHEEKLGIAKRYLVPKQLRAHGLKRTLHRRSPTAMLRLVITEYTREAGVRSLERQIATLCRKAATLDRDRASKEKIKVDEERVREWLGPRRFSGEVRKRTSDAGRRNRPRLHRRSAATCSSSRRPPIPGEGKLTITGQLGEVMQESAQAALSWVRSHTDELGPGHGVVRRARHPHPRARRRGAEGRPVGRA